MYHQLRLDTIFCMFYAAVTMLSFIACCYLLLRRANAIAPDVTPPVRLRRLAAAFFAALALSHVWYMPLAFLSSVDDIMMAYFIGSLLDCMSLFPLAIIVLMAMLQDRRRPLWPFFAMFLPPIAIMVWCLISRSDALLLTARLYLLLMGTGLTIYIIRAVRQYGSWLRDNYADLEHKEVWQSFVVLAIILLVFGVYVSGINNLVFQYIVQFNDLVLVCYLLWRVETLSDLSLAATDAEAETTGTDSADDSDYPLSIRNSIGVLLQQHCIDTQLYLQHDLTLAQLAQSIGTNRSYLSRYFSSQGTTYNAYINDLRIQHFVSFYHEVVGSKRSVTAQQLAMASGYRSYSTFCGIIKRKSGQSVTAWMKTLSEGVGES